MLCADNFQNNIKFKFALEVVKRFLKYFSERVCAKINKS